MGITNLFWIHFYKILECKFTALTVIKTLFLETIFEILSLQKI